MSETDGAPMQGDLPGTEDPLKSLPPAKTYVILLQEGTSFPATLEQLLTWVSDVTSWLNFMRMIAHPGYAAEMAVWLPGKEAETIRIVPQDLHVSGATFADPFKQAAQKNPLAAS